MDDPSRNGQKNMRDVTPYLKLVIDKEGRWFQNGAEIIHPEIYKHFNELLEKTADGGYQIRSGNEFCGVEVEDAPFVVQAVSEVEEGKIYMRLNDGSDEPLKPEWFWIGRDNVPYCLIKNGSFHARFSRPAYYALARHIVADEEGQNFVLHIDGRRTAISDSQPAQA
jgi:uncharacterized protein